MKSLKRISIVLGTRPEAIKLAPVIMEVQKSELFNLRIILTGQHKEIVNEVFEIFNITEDKNLKIMSHQQTLNQITIKVLEGLALDFQYWRPDLVLVQGDTTSAFAGALASFYEKIPVGHIEAGLRTENLLDPFPEEANRRLISQIASLHFAPTSRSFDNLKNSNVTGDIYVTGNTVIDALTYISNKNLKLSLEGINQDDTKIILMTIHRRENWGVKIEQISNGILKVLNMNKDIKLLLPMHPNEKVREPIKRILGSNSQVILLEPLGYDYLVYAMKNCYLLLTDSGGLQEEAPSLGKPVLVLRENTERPEAIQAGTAKLVGTDQDIIFKEVDRLLNDENAYNSMAKAINPYGDGKASLRIIEACKDLFSTF